MYMGMAAEDKTGSFLEELIDYLPDFTYITDDVIVKTASGSVIVDRSEHTTAPPVAPPTRSSSLLEAVGRVHPYVWAGAGLIAFLALSRR